MAPNKDPQSCSLRDRKSSRKPKSLKQKVRDVRRLLRQTDIPAAVRMAQESMLDLLLQSTKEKIKEERERKLAKKHKMVRFFEKRKILRKIKACQNELNTCACGDSEKSSLENQLQTLKDQWNYVVHFPSNLKYISLYPPVPYLNEAILESQEKIMITIKENIENKTVPDAFENIALSSPNQKKNSLPEKESTTQVETKATTDVTATEESPKDPEDEIFFIDTNGGASPEFSSEKQSNGTMTKKSTSTKLSVPGSAVVERPVHTTKRLKNSKKLTVLRKSTPRKRQKADEQHKKVKKIKKTDCELEEIESSESEERLAKKVNKKIFLN